MDKREKVARAICTASAGPLRGEDLPGGPDDLRMLYYLRKADAAIAALSPDPETEALRARVAELEGEVKRLRSALVRISSPSQSTRLLWWQVAARRALSPTSKSEENR